ncbi:MAG: hypothetical protein H0V12_02990 [Chloroflexi bacterium]|nr:hypothetical protein [Chloroflexota bacterium]
MDTNTPTPSFPSKLEHKHGLSEWSPMMPERSMETVTVDMPAPTERHYRCQRVGCTEVVRLAMEDMPTPATASEL